LHWIYRLAFLSFSQIFVLHVIHAEESRAGAATSPAALAGQCLNEQKLAACQERLIIAVKRQEADLGLPYAEVLCKAAVLSACTHAGRVASANGQEAESSSWLARSCAGGADVDGEGCMLRAALAERHSQPEAAARFRALACRAGHAAGCQSKVPQQ
jgi:hypothetical protein